MSAADFKTRLLNRFNSRCAYCGVLLTCDTCVTEHFIPKSRGGSNRVNNLVPACNRCNAKKGAKTIEELRSQIMRENPIHSFMFYFETIGYAEAVH